MQIAVKKTNNVVIVKPLGKRIDASNSSAFKGRILDLINEGNRDIVLDLSGVDFIDSSGLGAIISSLKTLGDEGDLVLCGIRDSVMNLFRLTRMNRVFKIFPDEKEGISALSK